jgi:dolichol-phosphate mannosyltransferase
MPLQLWVQAARLGLRVKEVGVPRLYIDPNRSFGAGLDDAEQRLAYYRSVLADAERQWDEHTVLAGCPELCPES